MSWLNRRSQLLVEAPHALVVVLVVLNVAAYALCFRQSGTEAIAGGVLFRNGAMYAHALERGEYWRLVAYGFLHVNALHLAGNMLCLVLWGGHLERRIGHLYFLLIYLATLVAGAVVTDFSQTREYLTVGASGATSGLLGALLFLGLTGKVQLSASFFVVNISLNVALAAGNSRINWAAHLGGFTAGLIGCVLLDLIERINSYALRCKFPEFVKLDLFLIICAAACLVAGARSPIPFSPGLGLQGLAVLAAVTVIGIKGVDLLLALRKGLAVIVALLALANASAVFMIFSTYPAALTQLCALPSIPVQTALAAVCVSPILSAAGGAAIALIVTLLACHNSLIRGLTDVGFVGNSLRGERARRIGL